LSIKSLGKVQANIKFKYQTLPIVQTTNNLLKNRIFLDLHQVFGQIEENAEGVVLAEAFGVVEEKAPVDGGDEEGEGGGTRREEPANFISWKKKM
jgi:hypothetical protein